MALESANVFDDNKDIHFHMENCIDWNTLIPLKESNFKDFEHYQKTSDEKYAMAFSTVKDGIEQYKSVLTGLGQISAKELNPNARKIDKEGFKFVNGQVIAPEAFKRNVQVLTENGYMGLCMPRKYGGWFLPVIINVMVSEICATGDVGIQTLVATQNLADVINKFGDEAQREKYVVPMASGEMGAAMLLTEPNYGSDLPNAQTKGEWRDGKLYVTGVKQFITHGCAHSKEGQVYLTVVRTVKKQDGTLKQGALGLSMVLLKSENAEITALEHKLGIHSSPTVQLSFDNAPGELVGEEGKGLVEYTLALMNGARLDVGAQGVGASEQARREAHQYANTRVQFGVLIKELPAVQKLLNEIDISTEASRALVYSTAQIVDFYENLAEKYVHEGLSLKEAGRKEDVAKWTKLAKVLTPFTKLYATEESNTNAYKAMQIFGGVGYSEELDIARIYRDARILSIYEGTSQLQVVAAIGGVLEGYSKDDSILLAYQKEIRDGLKPSDELKPFLEKVLAGEKLIKEITPLFKQRSDKFKGGYASNLVWAAVLVYVSHLFLVMAGKDASGEKTKKAKIYINDMLGTVKGTVETLKLQSEIDQ